VGVAIALQVTGWRRAGGRRGVPWPGQVTTMSLLGVVAAASPSVVEVARGPTSAHRRARRAVADGEAGRTVPHATWRSADHLWSHVSDAALLVHLL